ncbi:MAG: type II secretion system protein [Candidatus Saccharimonadota bacterium]
MQCSGRKNKKGFTIVELLIVVVVIAILAAITIVSFNGISQRAANTAALDSLRKIEKSMLMYRETNRILPPGADFYSGAVMPPPATWLSVVTAMQNAGHGQNIPVLDPWGQYFWYDNNDCRIGQGGTSPLKSVGPDGLNNTADDISITIVTAC